MKKIMQILSKETTVLNDHPPSFIASTRIFNSFTQKHHANSFSKKTTVHSSFVIYCFDVNFQLVYTKKTMQILSKETTVHSSSVIYCFGVKFQSVIYTKNITQILFPRKQRFTHPLSFIVSTTLRETASKNHPDSFYKQVTVVDDQVQKDQALHYLDQGHPAPAPSPAPSPASASPLLLMPFTTTLRADPTRRSRCKLVGSPDTNSNSVLW